MSLKSIDNFNINFLLFYNFFIVALFNVFVYSDSRSTPKKTLRMRVALLDVSLTWNEFLPVILIDAPADVEVQVHADSQIRHILKMVRNTLPECRFFSTNSSSLIIFNQCELLHSPAVYLPQLVICLARESISKVK